MANETDHIRRKIRQAQVVTRGKIEAMKLAIAISLALVFALPSFDAMRSAVDYDTCHSDLDTLRWRSDDAATKAEAASDAERQYKDCLDDSHNRSGCSLDRSHDESAKDDLESALDDVASKVRSVSSSCGFDLAAAASPDGARLRYERTKQRYCNSLNGMKGIAPLDSLYKQCRQAMSDQECRVCLGIK